MCINVLARQQFMNFKHYTGVAAEIDRSWSREMKLYLTGESTMGDFVPPQILLEKSILKNVDIKPDPINSTVSFACISWPREIEVVVKQDLASWRNFNSSEVPTREICVVGCELPGLKTREQPFAALPVLLPQPLCHSFEHPIMDMKAGTLKMASAQVFITEQSYINIWALRSREDSLLAAASTSPGRGSTIYVTIAKRGVKD